MSAIFYHGDEQRKLAEETRNERQKQLTKKIVTKITPAESFYAAEEYVDINCFTELCTEVCNLQIGCVRHQNRRVERYTQISHNTVVLGGLESTYTWPYAESLCVCVCPLCLKPQIT